MNYDELFTMSLESRTGNLADNVSQRNALLKRLQEKGKIDEIDGGSKILEELEYGFLELPKPDFTIFLYVPYDKVAELKGNRAAAPDQHESNPLHIRNAEHAYLELAELHNYQVIKCVDKNNKLRDIENIQEEIFGIVAKELEIDAKTLANR